MDKNQVKLIGTRLKKLRKQVGLSRKKISEIYNFPENTIKTWEAGDTEIGVVRLSKYLEIFHNFGFYIDLNSIINSQNSRHTETITFVQPDQVSTILQNLTKTNTMFHALANGLVVYFNPKYEFFLDNIGAKNIMPLHLENIFNNDCNTILQNTEQTRVVSLNKTLSNVRVDLTLKLYSNIDSYKRLISLTGFVLT